MDHKNEALSSSISSITLPLHKTILMDNKDKNPVRVEYFQDYFDDDDNDDENLNNNNNNINNNNNNKKYYAEEQEEQDLSAADKFFELANAPIIGYKIIISNSQQSISASASASASAAIFIQQDNSCQSHTGGIVWETAYLLANYLIAKYKNENESSITTIKEDYHYHQGNNSNNNNDNNNNNNNKKKKERKQLGKTLEVGSGCGMLGLILAASGLCKRVVLTETNDVMANLQNNVQLNLTTSSAAAAASSSSSSSSSWSKSKIAKRLKKVSVRQLRWDAYEEDIKSCHNHDDLHDDHNDLHNDNHNNNEKNDLDPHTFDTIIGTDVIFAPKLVKPLLETLCKMSHERTNIYLCVQIRCQDSHALFLKMAKEEFDLECNDLSSEFSLIPSCAFGVELECHLFHLIQQQQRKKKSRKRDGAHSKDKTTRSKRSKKTE